jgi:ComEC/Rec2-related protein
MVGGEPPYARAYLGGLALGLGALIDREAGAFQALVLSAWIILLADPRALFSAGFQMTYAAMIGLILAMPRVDAGLPGRWPKAARGLCCVAAVTVIVQLMLWPIFANTFGRAAALGACANLALVPLSGVILAGGFIYWIVGHGAPVLSSLLSLLKWICFQASNLPWAAVNLTPLTPCEVLAYYLFAAAILILPRRRIAAVLAASAITFHILSLTAARFSTAPLHIVYLSLPSETAALAWRHGKTILIGPAEPSAPVYRAMKALGVRRLDETVALAQNRRFSLCEGGVCFRFDPPRVLRGSEEFDIIASRLKRSSLEASTDGSRIEIKEASGARH